MKLLKKFLPYIVFLIVTLILFKDIVLNLNSKYFSTGGDGLKSYYCSIYHINFDKDSRQFNGMNYPWGESIYFTDAQPPLTNAIGFVDKNLFSCADFTLGIINFMMIFSVFLTAVFIFLIMRRFKMPNWYATIIALLITFLSPQIGRMAGHFSLSWGFWIPLLIYMLILLIEKETWWKSILFGIITLLASLMHMYFFVFSVALIFIFQTEKLIFHFDRNGLIKTVFHFSIQIIIPFVLLQLIMNDNQVDRTMHPFGFYGYRAYPGTIFLPLDKWYVPFISELHFTHKYEWESLAYIGIITSAGFWYIFGKWIINLFKKEKRSVSFTHDRTLDILFWTSFLLLLFSFGFPFILGFERLRNSIGFLSQLRAIGRFSWLFYYVINIIIWIKIFNNIYLRNKTKQSIVLILILISIMGFEAYNSSVVIKTLNNEIPQLADKNNILSENKWVSQIDPEKYQAIMPLPYFHVGSESIWMENKCGIDKQMFIASLKTGLPCNGVMLGRTSLSQTYKNIELVMMPWEKFRVLDEYPTDKPLLLIVSKCDELNRNERRLIGNSTFITSSPDLIFFELQIDSLSRLPAKYHFPLIYKSIVDSVKSLVSIGNRGCYIYTNGNIKTNGNLLQGIKTSVKFQRIIQSHLKLDVNKEYYIRFWVKDFVKDMVANTEIRIDQLNEERNILNQIKTQIWRHIKTFNDDWAMVEISFITKQNNEIVEVLFKNSLLEGEEMFFDEITISQTSL